MKRYLHVTVARDSTQVDSEQTCLDEASFARAADCARHLLNLKGRLAESLSTHGLDRTFSLESQLLAVTHALNENGWYVDLPALRSARELMVTALSTPGAANAASLESRITQIDQWLRHVSQDGRLRCTYHSLGTVTGRFSASKPNLQNVPRGHLRKMFCASEGCALVIADLSQIELRIAAMFAGDREMLDIFRRGKDLHRLTAAAVLRKSFAEVTTEDRQVGKATNFGLIFGQGVAGFVLFAGKQGVYLTEAKATRIRDRFFDAYPGIAGWHRRVRDGIAPHRLAVGRTIGGRVRYLPDDASDWDQFQAHVNYVVQGSAAELFKTALVEMHPQLEIHRAHLIGVVHDEVIIEAPSVSSTEVTELLRRTFEEVFVRLFSRLCECRFQRSLSELFRVRPACEVQTYVCANWAEKA